MIPMKYLLSMARVTGPTLGSTGHQNFNYSQHLKTQAITPSPYRDPIKSYTESVWNDAFTQFVHLQLEERHQQHLQGLKCDVLLPDDLQYQDIHRVKGLWSWTAS